MKNARLLLTIILATACCFSAGAMEWKARWISREHCQSTTNSWLAFKHIHHIDSVPSSVVASIAADSRYWLWINDEPVVREGGLKRGPAPGDSYFDRVEIAPYLKQGDNMIAVLVWHFGKNGFSHLNSGTAALLFQAEGDGVEICSQTKGWQCSVHKGFGTALPLVNRRLPESSIRYEAGKWKDDWYRSDNYTGADDDRVQAMAIVSGLASADKYPALVKVIEREYHATTYMKRYVLDALFIAGEAGMALERMRKLYPTVMQEGCSTLWEHWNREGTNNHAWTGGGIIVLSQRVAGISPLEPGYKVFEVKPQMGGLKKVEAWMETSYGMIEVFLSRKGRAISTTLRVPEGTTALVHTGRQPEPESFGPGCHKFSIKLQ